MHILCGWELRDIECGIILISPLSVTNQQLNSRSAENNKLAQDKISIPRRVFIKFHISHRIPKPTLMLIPSEQSRLSLSPPSTNQLPLEYSGSLKQHQHKCWPTKDTGISITCLRRLVFQKLCAENLTRTVHQLVTTANSLELSSFSLLLFCFFYQNHRADHHLLDGSYGKLLGNTKKSFGRISSTTSDNDLKSISHARINSEFTQLSKSTQEPYKNNGIGHRGMQSSRGPNYDSAESHLTGTAASTVKAYLLQSTEMGTTRKYRF